MSVYLHNVGRNEGSYYQNKSFWGVVDQKRLRTIGLDYLREIEDKLLELNNKHISNIFILFSN